MNIHRRMILGAGASAGLALFAGGAMTLRARADEMTVDDVLHDPDGPVMGNPDGDVTIVEYFDYQCPFCKKNHPTLTEVVEQDGNVRLVMKDWPIFGAPSVYASQLVLGTVETGNYHDANTALMATEAKLSNDQIDEVLGDAGIDVAAAQAAYRGNRDTWDGFLARNASQAAQLGLRGTPAFIIGRTIYPGALDATTLRSAISEARGAS
ncbi:DsbA family protein [Paracoccus sp. TK19116]|uniref:DsbA family protein n=1 Tax=Paracoccus albicereus TaxID=2922394 RepID=A0ABT1MUF0_9RHOB|nr:DsbA family protein [Paracoccus albicereus]MCQ0971947.1 DsbA family protein [Paracoccus albicereus]